MPILGYQRVLTPFAQGNEQAVTLAAGNKALVPTSRYNGMGNAFFDTAGLALSVAAWGKMTTGATPGTLTLALLWGSNADATGTSLAATAAQTLIASQTDICWNFRGVVQCQNITLNPGTPNGSLIVFGEFSFGIALIAAGRFSLPATAPVAVSTLDLTGGSVPSLQALVSSGSGITMTVQRFELTQLT